ncbi:Voltage-gated Ion Channel (VIC) Superfamily [Achlya hypogyna]|uniref:Voltage-gated Ion Channel (VIC) Superfamily n=1 Tax=Achlya hypogyna TaxID=1202772 RepID=A0A1V9YQJ3_ACHHY|nr:Voltage-gated Ion Channel (VIC) Superfamily [Achlya hypogyna]
MARPAEMPSEGILERLLHPTLHASEAWQSRISSRISSRSNRNVLALLRSHAFSAAHRTEARSAFSSREKANMILKDLDFNASSQFSVFAQRHRAKVLDPRGHVKARWDIIVLLALLVFFVMLPLDVCFDIVDYSPLCLGLQIVVDTTLVLDVLVTLHTARTESETNALLVDPWAIARDYVKSFAFVVDVLSTLPSAYLPSAHPMFKRGMQATRVLGVHRLYRTAQSEVFGRFEIWLSLLAHPAAVRLIKLALLYIGLHHYLASAYYLVVLYEDEVYHGNRDKMWPVPFTLDDPITRQYVGAVYQAISVTGLGPMEAKTKVERIFTFGGYAVGMVVNACVFGIAAGLIQQLYKASDARQYHSACVATVLRSKKVDDDIQEAIYNYYSSSTAGDLMAHDPTMFQPSLPSKMELLLRHHLHRDVVAKVPFFATLTSEQVLALLLTMTESVALPGELIVKAGEKAHAFYIIETGLIHVCNTRGVTLTVLGPGGYFGEVSLMTNESTTANVVAQSYCKLNILLKEHFDAFTQENERLKKYLDITKTKRLLTSANAASQGNNRTVPVALAKPTFLGHVYARRMAKKIVKHQRQFMRRLSVHRESLHRESAGGVSKCNSTRRSEKENVLDAVYPWGSSVSAMRLLTLHIRGMSHFRARHFANLRHITRSTIEEE